jgi:hypothetical protein
MGNKFEKYIQTIQFEYSIIDHPLNNRAKIDPKEIKKLSLCTNPLTFSSRR